MKLSISLPEEDVATLDAHARKAGLPSRSAAVLEAVRMLRTADLEDEYAVAWDEWARSPDRTAWESAVGDVA